MRPTSPPGCRLARHPTRKGPIWLALIAGASIAIGCNARGTFVLPESLGVEAAPDGLRIRLYFGADADLDLYVTGPQLETAYFANTPTRIGGALERDVRCDEGTEIRIEAVTFPDAPPGRYRVGVDFPERCSRFVGSATYTIVVEGEGLRREHAGEIAFGRFEPLVLEFDYFPER